MVFLEGVMELCFQSHLHFLGDNRFWRVWLVWKFRAPPFPVELRGQVHPGLHQELGGKEGIIIEPGPVREVVLTPH
jgi:hypothetical protein